MPDPTLTVRGRDVPTGVYLLHIHWPAAGAVAFGRFNGGEPVPLAAGDYLYAGSAMGRGATALAGRLLRHATRCPPRPPHAWRADLAAALAAAGLPATPQSDKRRHWHIDYLLDEPAADLAHVWAARTAVPLEQPLVAWLAGRPDLHPAPRGLGASDHPGHTHLWRLGPGLRWAALLPGLAAWWATVN
jgi:Uri superfamily endonuclease